MLDIIGMAVIGALAGIGAKNDALGALVLFSIIAAWCLGRFAV